MRRTHLVLDSAVPDFLRGGGEMGRLVASMDWSATPLGAIADWPQSLRTAVSLCLASNFPISMTWGPRHSQIYNDGYWPICGDKHPRSMGMDFSECWASAWPVIGAAFSSALAGESAYLEDQRIFLDRYGYLEETFFTFSFSPIRDESGGVGGLFHPVTEVTGKILSERRTDLLRKLAARAGGAKSVEDMLVQAAGVVEDDPLDLCFALFYLLDADGSCARLAASAGIAGDAPLRPARIDLGDDAAPWPLGAALAKGTPQRAPCRAGGFGSAGCGPYPELPRQALVAPLAPLGAGRPLGFLVAGVSARLPLDDRYQEFVSLFANAVTAGVLNARAYEAEREKAEALAELDRAKTAFFSNVSHEFRTPLALMLGSIEDLRADAQGCAARRAGAGRCRPPQRPALAEAGQFAARLLPHRGRPHRGVVPADRPRAADGGTRPVELCLRRRAGLRLSLDCATRRDTSMSIAKCGRRSSSI